MMNHWFGNERWKVDRVMKITCFYTSKARATLLKSLFSIQSANQYVNIGLMLKATVCRFSSMANNIAARAPLVAVVGATGTGKSEVSLDIFFSPHLATKIKERNYSQFPNSWL